MRISVFKNDPGYQTWAFGVAGYDFATAKQLSGPCECIVTLDGIEQPLVQTADEELGYIDRDVLEDPNDPFSYKMNDDETEWLTERVYGKVEIKFVVKEKSA